MARVEGARRGLGAARTAAHGDREKGESVLWGRQLGNQALAGIAAAGNPELVRHVTQRRLGNQAVQRFVQTTHSMVSPSPTGLPEELQRGLEALSGKSLDAASVHYQSSEPARLGAQASAQGTEIHLAPGQERHLPHEAWHLVQQAQGRVPASSARAGGAVSISQRLEHEADVMGERASTHAATEARGGLAALSPISGVTQFWDDYYPDGGTEPHIHMHDGGSTFTGVGHAHKTIEDNGAVREAAIMEVFQILQGYDTARANDIIAWLEEKYDLHPPAPDPVIEQLKAMLLRWGGLSDDQVVYYNDDGEHEVVDLQGQAPDDVILGLEEEIRASDVLYRGFLETGMMLHGTLRGLDFEALAAEDNDLYNDAHSKAVHERRVKK